MSIYGDGMTDEEYLRYIYSLPAWKRRLLVTLAIAPFAAMATMIVLGLAGVVR
jgi:hypothetical protein